MTKPGRRTFPIAIACVIAILGTGSGSAQVPIRMPIVSVAPPVAPPAVPPVVTPPVTVKPVGGFQQVTTPPPAPIFYLRSYLGKCLDFSGPANPEPSGQVFSQIAVRDCNNSAAQQFRVEEVDTQHDVVLYAGTLVLGMHVQPLSTAIAGTTISSAATNSGMVYGLELQRRASVSEASIANPANQIFALDGDSIMLASNRKLVVQVENARGASGSAVVLGPRNLADSEFWDFNQINGADIDPTNGFVRAGYPGSLLSARDTLLSQLAPADFDFCSFASPACVKAPAQLGTVIKIYSGSDIDLSGVPSLEIPSGVTIRGGRRGTQFGPLLHKDSATTTNEATEIMLEIPQSDNVRITGLRLQGTSTTTDQNQVLTWGVNVHDNSSTNVIIDHNDISGWTQDGVRAAGSDQSSDSGCTVDAKGICLQVYDPTNRLHNTFVIRNFIHHNRMQEAGYGVEAYDGGYPFVQGNTFVSNRHAVAGGHGTTNTGYRAWGNLVLSDAPLQHGLFHVQDFDMHGTNNDSFGVCCFGGLGGDYVDIMGNTFLGTNRPNYALRAEPINFSDFRFNVSLESSDSAAQIITCAELVCNGLNNFPINVVGNQFNSADPTNVLAGGDFDGDGKQDLFLATGAAWYYSPQGNAEWRFLNPKIEKIDGFLFGDFDGDGRTDVVGLNGNQLMVSWGGASNWEYLNTVNAPITDLAVGKFASHAAGDRRDDIFWADGKQWYVSSGGTGPFTAVNASSFRVKDVRFGDFDGGGTTDVFAIVSGKWMVSYSATSLWMPLPKSLTNTMDGLVVADFDGDGRADIATSTQIINGLGWEWKFSSAGGTDWTYRWPANASGQWSAPLSNVAGIGNFDGNPGADVLMWSSDNHLYIVPGGSLQGAVTWSLNSRQDMR